jgi:hypothetical protein
MGNPQPPRVAHERLTSAELDILLRQRFHEALGLFSSQATAMAAYRGDSSCPPSRRAHIDITRTLESTNPTDAYLFESVGFCQIDRLFRVYCKGVYTTETRVMRKNPFMLRVSARTGWRSRQFKYLAVRPELGRRPDGDFFSRPRRS